MEELLTHVEVGGKSYPIVKKGREQAEQAVHLGKWIGRHGVPALRGLQDSRKGAVSTSGGLESLASVLDSLSADALIELFVVVIGCPKKVAEDEFDLAVLLDAAVAVYNQQPTLRRLIDRFFSSTNSEDSSDEPSTTSEPLTDGQTS